MPLVELRYVGPEGTDTEVVGAIEIIDDHLRIVAGSVVINRQPVAVRVPAGRYLARGWLPSGTCVRTTFEAPADRTTMVDLRPVPHTAADRITLRRPTGWLRSWSHDGRAWTLTANPQVAEAEPDLLDVTVSAPPGVVSVALQACADDQAAPPLIVLVPPGQAVRLSQVDGARGSEWRVKSPVGLGGTLMDYMHRSDVASADIVARHALADPDTQVCSELTELVLGYYLVQTGDERARGWVERLQWNQPDSVDVAVLGACLLRRDPNASVQVIIEEFARAADGGLPLLARGVRMLTAGLAAANDLRAEAALAKLRPYNTALGDLPLTTFSGAEPGQPMAGRAIWSTTRPANALTVPALSKAVENDKPAELRAAPVREHLEQALLRLHDFDAVGEGFRRVVVGDVGLTARASRSEPSGVVDLELLVDEPRDSGTLSLADLVVDLQVNSKLHWLGTFGTGNRCAFIRVPLGSWSLTARTRPSARRHGRALPLPQPKKEMAMKANDDTDELSWVMRTMLPLNKVVVVLRRDDDSDEYGVELTVGRMQADTIVGIEYGRVDDTRAFRVVPFTKRHHSRISSTLRLDRFDVRQPWLVFPDMTAAEVDQSSTADIAASVDAAATVRTADAWRQLVTELSAGMADVVRSRLDEQNRS